MVPLEKIIFFSDRGLKLLYFYIFLFFSFYLNIRVFPCILNILDVANEASIKSCFEAVTKICGGTGLSCLINNSGKNHKPDVELTGLTLDKFNDIFSVNTFGPAIVSKVTKA